MAQKGGRNLSWFRHLQLRWKLLVMVMPLVLVPVLFVAVSISDISIDLAYQGITRASKDDLEHMASFSLDLIDDHYKHHYLFQQEKERLLTQRMKDSVRLVHAVVETQFRSASQNGDSLEKKLSYLRERIAQEQLGDVALTLMKRDGPLLVLPSSQADTKDGDMLAYTSQEAEHMWTAAAAAEGKTLFLSSQSDEEEGPEVADDKMIAFRLVKEWGCLIVLERSRQGDFHSDLEDRAFDSLKKRLKEKKVGEQGAIFIADCSGILQIHAELEGKFLGEYLDSTTLSSFKEVCSDKNGQQWARSTIFDKRAGKVREKITRLQYFGPRDWVIFVEAFEDELYGQAAEARKNILISVIFLCAFVVTCAGMLSFYVAKRFTFPIFMMTEEIRRAKGTGQVRQINVPDGEELAKLADAFNDMSVRIQEDKAMEEKMARMEKMASIGVLSSGVAHEINNPMGVILGYACHLEGKLDREDPNYNFVQEIKQESKRCVKIVQNLLSYAKAPRLFLEEVKINDLLDHILDFAMGHADLEKIEVVRNYTDNLPSVQVDSDQFRQVIMNLILNAAAAMKDGGRLELSSSFEDHKVLVSVSDNGKGIPQESLQEVFEPFFTTKSKGTGLGLAISRQIVEAHMGAMEIESKVGEGTRVQIHIPVKGGC